MKDQVEQSLPHVSREGWKTLPLGSLAELRGRIGWKGLTAKEYTQEGPRFLSVHSLNYGDYVDFRDAFHISQDRYDESPEIMLQRDDILICKDGAGIGKLGIVPDVYEPTTINSSLLLIRAGNQVLSKYLYFCLLSPYFQKIVQSRLEGATTPHLYQRDITDFPVYLAPLDEQKRIVAVLDQAFAALDRVRAHAEANLAATNELFENWIAKTFDPQGAPSEERATLGEICRIQSGAGFPLKEQGLTEGEYPFYKVSDMNLAGNEWWLKRANNYIDDAARQRLRAAVLPNGSIVFPKVGGAIATNKKRVIEVEGCVDNNVMGLIADESRILAEYLHEWLHSFDIYDFSNKANPPSITQGTVAGWPLRVPSRDKQIESVAAIKALRGSVEQLRGCYMTTVADIAELRQSILQRAFSGQLTE